MNGFILYACTPFPIIHTYRPNRVGIAKATNIECIYINMYEYVLGMLERRQNITTADMVLMELKHPRYDEFWTAKMGCTIF